MTPTGMEPMIQWMIVRLLLVTARWIELVAPTVMVMEQVT